MIILSLLVILCREPVRELSLTASDWSIKVTFIVLIFAESVHNLRFDLLDKLLSSQDSIFVNDFRSATGGTVLRLWALTQFDGASLVYRMMVSGFVRLSHIAIGLCP